MRGGGQRDKGWMDAFAGKGREGYKESRVHMCAGATETKGES